MCPICTGVDQWLGNNGQNYLKQGSTHVFSSTLTQYWIFNQKIHGYYILPASTWPTYRGYLLLIYNFEDHLMIEFPVTGGETWPLSFPADLGHYESLGFSQGCSQNTMGAVLFEHSCVNSILCCHLLNPPSQSLWRHIFYGLVCEIKSESALAWGRGAILVK